MRSTGCARRCSGRLVVGGDLYELIFGRDRVSAMSLFSWRQRDHAGLFVRRNKCDDRSVRSWTLFKRVLPILAVVGLLIAPIAASQGAAAMAHMPVSTVDGMQSMAMPDEMLCCPDQMPAGPIQQKSCPFAVLCMVGLGPNAPIVAAFALRLTRSEAIALGNDMERDILSEVPPLRPPKV